MSVTSLILLILGLAAVAYVLARQRAMASAAGKPRDLHSRPGHYGWFGFILTAVPALLVLALWLIVQPLVIERSLRGMFPDSVQNDASALTLAMADVRRVAAGLDVAVAQGAMTEDSSRRIRADFTLIRERLAEVGVALANDVSPAVLAAAQDYRLLARDGALYRTILVLAVAVAGLIAAAALSTKAFRARNHVESAILALLMLASSVAILTTVGIVLSMVSEAGRFFGMYPIQDFLFGLTWNPQFRGNSTFGLLPLLWGTLYISFIALLVAVPLGVFTAIYLSEYASARVRGWVKPAIEVIAGIPTVVFGLFALVTVGPFLRDVIARPLALGDSGSSVMTAGIVIGILNIPFVSSLADDIMNAVPQSLRDASLGLGATRSETIRHVVLPAALPGIVGAILLAASRAIGETMIVTMGAGAAAAIDVNPFVAMTTITVKIVGSLTGDTAFDSPETLVAFALGITLFVLTLALNIFALYIVRKYREQYE